MTPCCISRDEDGVQPPDRSCLKNHENELRTAESEKPFGAIQHLPASERPAASLERHCRVVEFRLSFFSGVDDALAREAKRSFFFPSTRVLGVHPWAGCAPGSRRDARELTAARHSAAALRDPPESTPRSTSAPGSRRPAPPSSRAAPRASPARWPARLRGVRPTRSSGTA